MYLYIYIYVPLNPNLLLIYIYIYTYLYVYIYIYIHICRAHRSPPFREKTYTLQFYGRCALSNSGLGFSG